MVIYCIHDYGGSNKKKNAAARKIKKLQLQDKENTYLSPIHAIGWLMPDLSEGESIELHDDLITISDKVIVLSKSSPEVEQQIEMAKKLNIPIEYIRGVRSTK